MMARMARLARNTFRYTYRKSRYNKSRLTRSTFRYTLCCVPQSSMHVKMGG